MFGRCVRTTTLARVGHLPLVRTRIVDPCQHPASLVGWVLEAPSGHPSPHVGPAGPERHPEVAREFVTRLEAGVETHVWALPRQLPGTWLARTGSNHPRGPLWQSELVLLSRSQIVTSQELGDWVAARSLFTGGAAVQKVAVDASAV